MLDVVIVGGGPAGLATAIAARNAGLSVVVLDGRQPPLDKPCGEGLMPGGVRALAQLGIRFDADEARPFRGIRFIDAERPRARRADGIFREGLGLGVRRTVLHAALAARAAELGADLCWGVGAEGLQGRGVVTAWGTVDARFVIGADGLHSRVRRWAKLERGPGDRHRFGVRAHVEIPAWTPMVEVHWGRGVEAYVTPVGHNEVGIAFLCGPREAHFERLLERFPKLRERVAGAPRVSEVSGAGPFHQRVRDVLGGPGGNVALVGDASGYLDPITGEGLSLGFRQALVLARCLAADDLASYRKAHAVIVRGYYRMTGLLLRAQRSPWLRRRVHDFLARSPRLFTRLLAMNDGTASLLGVPVEERVLEKV